MLKPYVDCSFQPGLCGEEIRREFEKLLAEKSVAASKFIYKNFTGISPVMSEETIGMQKLAVNLIFISFFRIQELFFLQIQLFAVPLYCRLDNFPQIHRFLTNSGNCAFFFIINL